MSGDGRVEVEAVRTEHGWACPRCGALIGDLDGYRAPRVGQRCAPCGLWVVEVVRG